MAVAQVDACVGPLDPLCRAAGQVVGSASASAADLVLGALGGAFVSAAQAVSETAFDALDATTRIDLTATWFTRNLGVIAAVTLPALVALFTLQVIASVLRREPGGLGRAVMGVGKAMLGSALAISVTQMALLATDQICEVIASSAGTSVKGAALRFLKLSWLAGPQAGPVLQMLLGIAIIIGSMLLWAVLLFRKAAVLLVAVFAPVAFAGAAWDQTRLWTSRWIEAMAALVLCKVVIVVVFVLGMSAFGSDGTTTTPGTTGTQPTTTALSDLLVGLILLSIAVFAPWLTWRFVHWSGMEAASVLHGTMAASPVPGAVRSTASQARYMAQSAATTAVLRGAGGAVRGGGAASAAAGGVGGGPRPGGTQAPTPRSASNANPAPGAGTATTTFLDPSRRGFRRDGDPR
jgi:hypothetical protein